MDYELFKTVGAVAGIGGVAIAAVVFIFKEVIRKEIFPRLPPSLAYQLLNRIVILVFIIGVLGIAAYLTINWQSENRKKVPDGPKPTPTAPVLAELSGTVIDEDNHPLQGAKVTIDDLPEMKPVETSSDGVFTIDHIPKQHGEQVRIRVAKEGYKPNPYTEDIVLGSRPPRVLLRKEK